MYIFAWILYGVFHTVSMCFIIRISLVLLIIDAIIHASVWAGLGILLKQVLRHGKYETLLPIQQFINYVALSVLTVLLWLGMSYLLDYILLQKTAIQFLPTLPIRAMIGLQVYWIFILSSRRNSHTTIENDKNSDKFFSADCEIIDRITVKTGQKLHIIPLEELIYIQSDGDYVQLVSKDGKYLKEQTMKYFEIHLPQNQFVRIHRSYIVNIAYITRIESYGKQNQIVGLKNKEWLKVSISGYKLLKETLRL